jgi:hypothetical protein
VSSFGWRGLRTGKSLATIFPAKARSATGDELLRNRICSGSNRALSTTAMRAFANRRLDRPGIVTTDSSARRVVAAAPARTPGSTRSVIGVSSRGIASGHGCTWAFRLELVVDDGEVAAVGRESQIGGVLGDEQVRRGTRRARIDGWLKATVATIFLRLGSTGSW